ncbi:MAG: hypothetical protein ACLQVD_13215 [Capsulimonadaceae bacterium]
MLLLINILTLLAAGAALLLAVALFRRVMAGTDVPVTTSAPTRAEPKSGPEKTASVWLAIHAALCALVVFGLRSLALSQTQAVGAVAVAILAAGCIVVGGSMVVASRAPRADAPPYALIAWPWGPSYIAVYYGLSRGAAAGSPSEPAIPALFLALGVVGLFVLTVIALISVRLLQGQLRQRSY